MSMISNEVIDSVMETMKNGRLFRYDCSTPEESITSRFEKKFADTFGFKFAIAMNSCSSALFTSLLCAGIKPGDHVAVPAFTFVAVPSSIIHAGAKPVLIEVTEDYVMDPKDFEKKIHTNNIKALLLSYMRGRIPDLDQIVSICKKNNVVLLEDCAHSLGVLWGGVQTGKFGLAASYSAQSYKIMDSGEGGVMVTDDERVAYKAMMYAGAYEKNWRKHFGTENGQSIMNELANTLPAYNFRMSNLSSSALIPQISMVEDKVNDFNARFEMISSLLNQSEHIRIPKFHKKMRAAADSIQWEFINLTPEKIQLIQNESLRKGLVLEVFTGSNARCYWNWNFFDQNEKCEKTRCLLENTADMRLRLYKTPEAIQEVAHIVLSAINKYK